MKIRLLMGATALAGILAYYPVVAAAQTKASGNEAVTDAEGKAADKSETILVTGSRIPRPESDGVLPGVQVSAQQIEARGFTNALEALNDIPLVGPGATPLTGNNGGQAASLGSAFVDLLDLGTSRTLTLVNGRRYVSGNSATLFVDANATGSQVDVNTIPSSLIKRIDVVTVGGAAAYGSDAIAGVVNFILKSDFEGLEVGGLAGISDRKDAAQYQLRATAGHNFLDGRANLTIAAEYTRSDGVQADAREFRLERAATLTNYANGSVRNPAFASAIIDVQGANNGAFLRNTDDGQPATGYGAGLVNQTLSFNGTILNTLTAPPVYYTPLTQTVGTTVRTSNFIALQNGIGAVGNTVNTPQNTTVATPNQTFFNTAVQLVNGLPGATLISGNGLNGRTTPIANLPITTFAPTALPTGVTAAQVFTQFNITPPAGATATQLSTLAINVLQANRPTAREFFANNPGVNVNAFIGTFIPGIPRIANTNTTLVTVAGVQVPQNQVLPFIAVPLEFNTDGSIRPYTAATLTPTLQGTIAQAPGSNGGFSRSVENIVLRTQQDRYIGNLLGKFDITDNITLFTENLFSHVENVSVRNSPSQNFITTGAENAALVLNVNNPYLSAANLTALDAVGINAATNGGSFALTRQNQDIFGNNPFKNTSDTYRIVGGARGHWDMFGHKWSAEASGTYGSSKQLTETTQINDIEYQLALDVVRDPATGTIRCRSQLFPGQYLGRTPLGTVANLTRTPGADGLPTETVFTPTITQDQINRCQPLNPFGYDQMSQASKDYVRQNVLFSNLSTQTYFQASFSGAFFNLPAGELAISGNAEYRRETLDFRSDALNQLGRGRAAPSAQTQGSTRTIEYGGEARIPIFGRDFAPFLGSLVLNPSVRLSQQSGSASSFRNLAGNVISPTANGEQALIWSGAGEWQITRDIKIRGNYSQSIRQPSVVELFLGGQPAFATPTDPCGPANIDSGVSGVTRRANCRADVISRGLATTSTTADAFLATFVPNPNALPGTFAGAPGLSPERGKSWTVGAIVTPRWVPGLTLSADYINLDLTNIIQPTSLAQALQFCYESRTFPDTSAQTGANTCGFFSRQADFQVASGFASGFINLSATQLRAFSIAGNYSFALPWNVGDFNIRGNGYHLVNYTESAAGDFSDATESAGTFNRPEWEVQVAGRYQKKGYFAQVTWNWRAETRLFTNGAPSTIENFPNVIYPSTSTFDVVVGLEATKNFRIQFNVVNLTDTTYAGQNGLFNGAYVDQIGRRFQLSSVIKF